MLRLGKKYKDLNQKEIELYVQNLSTEHTNKNAIIDEMDKKIGQLLHTGQEPIYQLTVFEPLINFHANLTSDYSSLENSLNSLHQANNNELSVFEPELLLPMPVTLDIETTEFLTPFPFIIETPTINPMFNTKDILVSILNEAGKADANKLKVS